MELVDGREYQKVYVQPAPGIGNPPYLSRARGLSFEYKNTKHSNMNEAFNSLVCKPIKKYFKQPIKNKTINHCTCFIVDVAGVFYISGPH